MKKYFNFRQTDSLDIFGDLDFQHVDIQPNIGTQFRKYSRHGKQHVHRV